MRYGVSFVRILEKISCVIMAPHCISVRQPADVRPSIFAKTSVGKIFWLQHFKNGFLLSISLVKDSDDIFVQKWALL